MDDICKNCDGPIEIAIFKGTGYCSDWCKKGIARFRPDDFASDEPIPELLSQNDVELSEELQAAGIDPATIIFEPDVDLNELLQVCLEDHTDPNEPEVTGQAFMHQSLFRICLNVHGTDIWVYNKAWDEAARVKAEENTHSHDHGPEGHTH